MQTYRIRITNADFESSCEANAHNRDAARSEALRAALQIGTDEICEGQPFFGAEVQIENEHAPTERLLIAIGASPLL
jgi:hypothetical protein